MSDSALKYIYLRGVLASAVLTAIAAELTRTRWVFPPGVLLGTLIINICIFWRWRTRSVGDFIRTSLEQDFPVPDIVLLGVGIVVTGTACVILVGITTSLTPNGIRSFVAIAVAAAFMCFLLTQAAYATIIMLLRLLKISL